MRFVFSALAIAFAVAMFAAASPGGLSAETGPLAGKSICLDAGHGGSEPGAVSSYVDGIGDTVELIEKDINLDEALYIEGQLLAAGADNVYMTRTTDTYLSTHDRYEFCNGTGADILVSIHTNSYGDTSVDGSWAVYFHNDDKVLAQAIVTATCGVVVTENTTCSLRRDALGVLLKSNMPAAVAEPVFMSNPAEAQALATPIDGDCGGCLRQQIGDRIVTGILAYFASQDGGNGGGGDTGGGGNCPPAKERQGKC